MESRLDYARAASPEAMHAVMGVQEYLGRCSLEPGLMHLVQMRASQINGCAFCLELHGRELREGGERQERIDCLRAWRETTLYTDRERGALAWTEALTLLSQTHAPDEDYEAARIHFSDRELVDLTLAISMINVWNRFSVGFRRQPDPDFRSSFVAR